MSWTEPKEIAVVRDEFGEVFVPVKHAFECPWYEYKGHCRINGDIWHFFEFS